MTTRRPTKAAQQAQDIPADVPALPQRRLTKAEQALRLAAHGHRLSTIAMVLQVTLGQVKDWVRESLPEIDPIDVSRRLEIARLDIYLESLQARIERGDDKAINAALRVAEQRALLLGHRMPVKIDATVQEITAQDRELQELINEARAKSAADEAALLRRLQGGTDGSD